MHARLRMLMNAQDASPGGGAPAAAPSTEPQAQGAPLTLDDLHKVLGDFKNSVLADTRRMTEAIAGKKKGEPKAEAAPQPDAPKAIAPEDYQRLRARDRAFERSIRSVQLTDAQATRMERAFELEAPEDVAGWCAGYIADLGLGKQAASAASPQTTAPSRSATPVSDGGAPAPVTTPSDQVEPWRLSEDDVKSVLRSRGYAAGGAELREQFRRALRGRRIRLK